MEFNKIENDPIIKEMEIQLDPMDDAQRLVLLHFPLCHPSQDLNLTSARYKPQLNMLHLEQALPEVSPNIDPEYESSGKIVYHSTSHNNNQNFPVLCHVNNGQLHWLPFHSVLTMKPSYPDVDARTAVEQSSTDADPAEARVINVRFASIRTSRGNSYQHHQQRAAQEPWTDLTIHENGDLSSLVAEASERPVPPSFEKLDFEKAFGVASTTDPQDLTLLVKQLLTRALVVDMEEVVSYLQQLQGGWTRDEIFNALFYQAYHIHNAWVVKSELLFPESSHGLPSPVLVQIRDYLLWRFTLSAQVSKTELQQKILLSQDPQKNIPVETLTELLKTLGKSLPDCPDIWEIYQVNQASPVSLRYQESIDRQQLCWKRRFRSFSPKDVFCCQ